MDDRDRPDDAETVEVTPPALGGPVDPPDRHRTLYATILSTRNHPREPIVPAWLRSRRQCGEVARNAAGYFGYLLARHAKLSPQYAAKTAMYAPWGVIRGVGRAARWASAEEGNWHLRQEAASRGGREGAETWLKLDGRRQRQASWRWPLVIVGAILAAALVLALLLGPVPRWARWVVLAAAVPMFARLGRPADKPILDRVTRAPAWRKLTADATRRALVATGKVKEPGDVKFPRDIYRDPPGQTALVDLPDGVIATDIIDKREQLAAGFRLPLDQVWPEAVKGEHPGQLRIWVADRPVSTQRQPAWPLLDEGTVDYFAAFPYGFDIRMRQVTWRLDERNSLFGGIPGSGKSLAARNVLLGAVLDPLVIPAVSELAGKGDYDMFEPLCPKGLYVCGADDRSIARTMRIIEWLDQLCEERGPLVAQYARQGLNTVKKVNRAMAERDERLRPVVAMFDEFQEFASSPYGIKGDGAAMLLSVIKRARALAIHVIVATQRFDKDSCPKAISSLVSNRACLSVPAQPETDMVLGTSAYRTGARPNAFVPGEDSGWMVRAGFVPGYETVRAAYVDDQAAERVVGRALAVRGDTGGLAPVNVRTRDLLDDVLRVFATVGRPSLHWQTLAGLLGELDPEAYGRMSPDAVSALVRDEDVPSKDVKLDGTTLKGCYRRDIEAAVARREITDGR